jgi:UDP-glucose:(heptosyl)LPS alpha-1,3-glucosyltransferase
VKIAFIRKKFVLHGGAEHHAADFLTELTRLGHEVHLFAHKWSAGGKGEETLRFHPVPMLKCGSFFKTLTFALNARKAVEKVAFDIIQSNDKTLRQDIYRAGDGCHRQWLIERGHYLSPLRRLFIAVNPFHLLTLAIEKRIFAPGSVKRVIAISEMGKKEIVSHYGVDPAIIRVIYNGVDLELFRPPKNYAEKKELRKRFGIGANDFCVLFLGSGFERKGVKFLIEAAGILKLPKLKLVIAGKGKSGVFTSLIEKLGLTKKVIFTGIVKERELLFRAADIFVFPTIYEPFGNVNLEALASGLPVVTTSRSGAAEILSDGETGYVVEKPDDTRALADAVALLAGDLRRTRMGRNARLLATRFTLQKNAGEVLALYQEVLDEKREK